MYRVIYAGDVLHDPTSDDRVVTNVTCKLSIVGASTLTFTVPKTNPYSGTFELFRRDKEVLLERDGETIFRGRILTMDTDFYGNEVITAESERSYLNDVLLPPFSTDGNGGVAVSSNPADLFVWFIQQYNAKQDSAHQFRFGINEAGTLTDSIQANETDRVNVWNAIKVRLMDRYGGWVRVRYSEGLPYIDYLTDSNSVNAQEIRFGVNLLDYANAESAAEFYTRIIPTSQEGDTVSSLPDGPVAQNVIKTGEYVVNTALESVYGVVETTEAFETNDPNKLLQDGIMRVRNIGMADTLTITAFDLALINPDVQYIQPGDYVRVISEPHNLDQYYICWEREIHPTDPAQDRINLGTTEIKLTKTQAAKLQQLDSSKANVSLDNTVVDVVSDVRTVYATSASDSTQPSTWQNTIPSDTNEYLWSKTTVELTDGTTDEQAVVTMNPRAAGEASQYVTFVSTGADAGLHIHENASSYNVDGDLHLDSGGVEIRDSGTVLASFGASTIELGKNHTTNDPVAIDLMNGIGTISVAHTNNMGGVQDKIRMSGDGAALDGERLAQVYSTGRSSIILPGDENGSVQLFAGVGKQARISLNGTYDNSGSGIVTIQAESVGIAASGGLGIGSAPYNISYGTAGQVLTSQGAGQPPVWAAASGGGGGLTWQQLAQTTGTNSASLNLTGFSTVLVVADVLRNSAHHFFSCNFPVACISGTAAEYKLGGYVGSSASTSGGAWCSMSLTSFAGVGSYINNTSFLTATTWTVYGAAAGTSTAPVSLNLTIQTSDWSGGSATITATGVTSSNTVIVSPDPASIPDWTSAGIACSAQGTGTLTFTCSTSPSSAVNVNALVFG